MKIGLVDVDNHNFPNIALMKLATYHQNRGDDVEWANALFGEYDILYKAKVFTFTPDDNTYYKAEKVICGGTGYDLKSRLPYEAEHSFPDYSLYGISDTAYGYLSRGCPRGCSFCIVKEKEGGVSVKVANLTEWWNGQKYIKLMDPNITACPDFEELMQQLIDSKAWIDFTQGLDIRLMTPKKADMINSCKLKMMHFAWDNPDDTITPQKLKEYVGAFKLGSRNKRVYVLTNYGSSHEQDYSRVMQLREMGYDPFVMVYEKWNAPTITKRLQRWVNNKFLFYGTESFEAFLASYKRG